MMVNEKATILIVDDTPDNLRILSEILNQFDYRVLAFKKGRWHWMRLLVINLILFCWTS